MVAESNTVVVCWGDVAFYSFCTWIFEFVGCMCKSDDDEDHCRNRWRHLPWSRCLAWNGVSLLLQWEPSLSQNGWWSILLAILHPSCSRSPAEDSSQWSKHGTEIELYYIKLLTSIEIQWEAVTMFIMRSQSVINHKVVILFDEAESWTNLSIHWGITSTVIIEQQ